MHITIPDDVVEWLREPADSGYPELLRELRIQLSSPGTEHHPARITAVASLWEDMADPSTGCVRSQCLVDAEGPDVAAALERLDERLADGE
ncbi:MAG: hypothetical protein M5U28_21120 [Sandaracinaceae bacterium]|nr:hypothetical protein [Sandaracinaceae bacterium]